HQPDPCPVRLAAQRVARGRAGPDDRMDEGLGAQCRAIDHRNHRGRPCPHDDREDPLTTRVLVTGAGGFIGHHLVTYLKERGYWVRGVDIKLPEYTPVDADEFELLDLRRWDA